MQTTGSREFNEIEKRVFSRAPKLIINSVPRGTFEWFKEFSEEGFEGSYGFALKFLCDVYKGTIPNIDTDIVSELKSELDTLKAEVIKLKASSEDSKEIKNLDGSRIETIGGKK